jgi:hypothetical protein
MLGATATTEFRGCVLDSIQDISHLSCRKVYRSKRAKQRVKSWRLSGSRGSIFRSPVQRANDVAHRALGEMLPLNVATVAPTALESPRDQGSSSGRRKF